MWRRFISRKTDGAGGGGGWPAFSPDPQPVGGLTLTPPAVTQRTPTEADGPAGSPELIPTR